MNIIVTGACGFIGTNFCLELLKQGHFVIGIDNFSRKGSEDNYYDYLRENKTFVLVKSDIHNDISRIDDIFDRYKIDAIFHLAAQTAVTKSIDNPFFDFYSNVTTTLTLLEVARLRDFTGIFVNIASNKVYGSFDCTISQSESRYIGIPIDESRKLEGSTPYGCSKLAADQYTLDYSKIYGLKTVSLRQSCIYGGLQRGSFDQGWVSHFCKQAVDEKPITICGNGKQVRDLLHVDDLIRLYLKILNADWSQIAGNAFNVGGGQKTATSILETIEIINDCVGGLKSKINFSNVRIADQKYFVSDNHKAEEFFNWFPSIVPEIGIMRMLEEYKNTIKKS